MIFQNYHRHSFYTNPTIADSTARNEDYAKRAVELGHGILSTMEHGHQGRYIEGYDLSKEFGLKFLFGTEAYWVKDRQTDDGSNCHIYLGAKNENGRRAINNILSEANLTGFYRRPRIDVPLILSLPSEDVWVTTACVAYWKYDDIDTLTERFAEHFGKNFFLEVQYHDTERQRELNSHILCLRDKLKVPIIMGCDSHYILPDGQRDREDYVESKGIHYEDEVGWYMDYPDGDAAYRRFVQQGVLTDAQIREAIDQTNVFLNVQEYDSPIFNTQIKMPSVYPNWTQEQKDAEYERLVWQGWDAYKDKVPPEQHEHYKQEIQSEIDTVRECAMSDYFILNYHVIRQGKENGGWLTKTGRGSAVSFITNMLLGFTEVDRIAAKVKMYPDRFMSATRILQSASLPDIDHNVANQEPFALAQKQILGEEHSYPMIAYGTLKTSAAWKLYAKSQGVPFELANSVSEQIKRYEEAVKQADEDDKEDIDPLDFIDSEYHEIFEKSKDYRGIVSSWSIAPCAYLLYQGNIREEIGLIRIKDHICCMMDGHWAEANHFLKNDLLKVSVVELIYKAYRRIGMEPPSVTELLAMCPPDDAAWKLYAKSCCMGLNQVERKGTAARVANYKPQNISELCAFVAAIRPGFKSMYKVFESRKPFSYNVKAFDSLLQTEELPQSFCLYQEQEMAALHYAGIPMSECYTAIKNIAKKRAEKVLAYKQAFIDGFSHAIVSEEDRPTDEANSMAHDLWQIIEDSSRYSFNASHSYCVSCDSLYSAWLKAHHPVEFYETLLRIVEVKGDKDKIQDIRAEAMRFFKIKFPPLAFGQDNRNIQGVPEKNTITSSITTIKGFGKNMGDCLYACAQNGFTSFMDVLLWLWANGIKAPVETLIKLDYFKSFGNQRELLRMLDFFQWFKGGEAKQIRRDRVDGSVIESVVRRHAAWIKKDGSEAKSYTLTDVPAILHELEELVLQAHMDDLDTVIKAQNYADIMGRPGYVSGEDRDRSVLYLKKVFPLHRKSDGKLFGYSFLTQSIGSGIESRFTVFCRVYNKAPARRGDIIRCKSYERDGSYFIMTAYELLHSIHT